MKIALIYNFESPLTTGAYIEKVLKNSGIQYDLYGVTDPSLIKKGYDLYLRIDHGDYKFDLPDYLRPAVFYAIDTHLVKPYKKIRNQVKHYDVVFCAQKDGALKLRKETGIDAQWLPLGCDPDIHKKLEIPKIYDIGFVGRNAQKFSRGRHLPILKEKYPNSFIGQIDFKKMCEVYSASKIGFNSSIVNDINMRYFEVMSCGCFLLTNKIKANGFEEIFTDGKHLVAYKNDKDLISKIEYYLKHEEERELIAKSGFDLVRSRFTYFHLVQTLFNYLAFKFGGEFNKLRI